MVISGHWRTTWPGKVLIRHHLRNVPFFPRFVFFSDKWRTLWPTSGLKPLVKSFMRLRVGPRSTLLQFKSTLSRAWVAQELGISCETKKSPIYSVPHPKPIIIRKGVPGRTVLSGQSLSALLIFTQHLFIQLSTYQLSGDMENGLRHHPALKRLPVFNEEGLSSFCLGTSVTTTCSICLSPPLAFPLFHFPNEENGSIPPSRKNTEPSRPGGQRTCYSQYHHQSQMYHPPR